MSDRLDPESEADVQIANSASPAPSGVTGEPGARIIPSAEGTVTLSLADFPPDFLDYLKAVADGPDVSPPSAGSGPSDDGEFGVEGSATVEQYRAVTGRCARDSDWCDGVICRERGIDCPNADPPAGSGLVALDDVAFEALYNKPLPSFYESYDHGWTGYYHNKGTKFLRWFELSEERKQQVRDEFAERVARAAS